MQAYWEKAIQGAIILLAVVADGLRSRAQNLPCMNTASSKSSGSGSALLARHETVLLLVLLVEIAFLQRASAAISARRTTSPNIVRQSVEIGLLALVMTPIILTGGIDLSVGSLLGLCAVVFGKLWRDAGLPPWLAALGDARRRRARAAG